MKLSLPQSLTAQFALVVSCLAALVVAVGATTIYSLAGSAHAIRQLADERLARLEDAQDLAQHTLMIERLALQLSSDDTVEAVRETHGHVIEQLSSFDRLVDRLASATTSDDPGVDALALHRSSQRFRNAVNIEAQMRETALGARAAPASTPRPDASLARLDDDLRRHADALAVAARQQSNYLTRDYRKAIQDLAEDSDRTRRWVVGEVAVSLLLAWLIARGFLGRQVVARLRRVSHALRHGDAESTSAGVPVHGGDEIADMARAVEQFLEDRRQRRQAEDALKELNADLEARVAQRTAELSTALAGQTAEIVERQHAEEAARASEHFLDSIVENIPDVIFVKDAATLRFVRFNKAGEQLLGYRREELIGKSVHDLFPVQEARFFALKDRAVLESRQMVDVPEEPVHTRHGPRLLHTMKIPILDVRGEPQFLLGISRDITEQKRAEAELHESERRYREVQMALAHANRVTTMGQLSASIAHEIKQPIAANATHAEAGLLWLRAQPPNVREARRAFEQVIENARRAGQVMNRIHGLVKNAPPSKESLKINEAIGEVIALTRSQVVRNSVTVRMQLAEDLPHLEGDRVQLQQVMLNLIINAVEAMSAVDDGPREMTISTGKDKSGGVLVSVRDSGPGVALDNIERIFEPFYTSKADGMGMGLSICRSIVEAHGGRLWVNADLPRGAVFQFTVPATRPARDDDQSHRSGSPAQI
ncbi:Adaptive-response sensory-kinase SasA [Paraburkholderia ultramafica]|uniref:histidine kinase n=1 Tax=Paraburkholderia ultramafica TaxID=1544867 RepID=A0A6S7BQ88_9BURK|nr:sensor histidine kinase [Paraburkholderia ultramafica]CAB3809138.1 Adaptive-response sensory-kinase SasA [Paraburkholderia ultramafica]